MIDTQQNVVGKGSLRITKRFLTVFLLWYKRESWSRQIEGDIWHQSHGLVGAIFRQDFCSPGSFFVAHINMTIPWHYLKELSKKELRSRTIDGNLN